MAKKIIHTDKLCVECKKCLVEGNIAYYCDNSSCDRYGLLTVIGEQDKKEVRK